jgi:hypothetical protein
MQVYTHGMLIAQRYRITRLLGSGGMSAVYLANGNRSWSRWETT